MTLYTVQQLSSMLDALTSRVNALDGQGLPSNQIGGVPQIILQLNSVKEDLSQLAASFENELNTINLSIANVQSQINTLSGVPNTQ